MKFGLDILSDQERILQMGLAANSAMVDDAPDRLDVRDGLLESSDQGATAWCAAGTGAGFVEYWRWKLFNIREQIALEPIYEAAKKRDRNKGDGTTFMAVVEGLADIGLIKPVPPEKMMVYYTPEGIGQALHRFDVVMLGLTITDAWAHAKPDGFIPPGGGRIGGHGVLACARQRSGRMPWVGFQNTWGKKQGYRGFNRLGVQDFRDQFMYALAIDGREFVLK
jgi:hypothetical protein